jgi:hypothetical protein
LDEYDSTHYGEAKGSGALGCRVQDLQTRIAAKEEMVDINTSHGGMVTKNPQFVELYDHRW